MYKLDVSYDCSTLSGLLSNGENLNDNDAVL